MSKYDLRPEVKRAAARRVADGKKQFSAARRAKAHRREAVKAMSADERRRIVDAFIAVIEGVYAHLPLKRATYGHDPVQRLRALHQRADKVSEREFHESMAEITTDLRDAHTRYIGPAQPEGEVAFLPISIERYADKKGEHYIISKISKIVGDELKRFKRIGFVPGAEVTHWNGVPIARAVDMHAERETGGRPDARKARAVESLTLRPLRYAFFPDEEWVDLTFKNDTKDGQVRLQWEFVRQQDPLAVGDGEDPAALAFAADPAAEAMRREKKFLFATEKWHEVDAGRTVAVAKSAAEHKTAGEWFAGTFQDAVAARVVEIPSGTFGHLRLWSFDLRDDDGFLAEVIELLSHLPRTGLIVDLRGNPGGLVWAAERLLQLLTPNEIVPTRFSMLATDLTRSIVAAPQNQRRLEPWRRSLESAVVTGELYSRGVPLTPPARCNDIGQRYPGPVVAIVDANTYSSGDLFAAGFVDNAVGTLVSVDEATGAGGANVWTQEHVKRALSGTEDQPPALPDGVNYSISFRRAMRVGDALGTGIEDVGIRGHVCRPLTKRDLTSDNVDLLNFCGRLLKSEPKTDMVCSMAGDVMSVETTNLDRVDMYVDNRPYASLSTGARQGTRSLEHVIEPAWSDIEVVGFAGAVRRQRRLLRPGHG